MKCKLEVQCEQKKMFIPILNFPRIQILFPPQTQIQIEIMPALHTPSNYTQPFFHTPTLNFPIFYWALIHYIIFHYIQ